MRVLVNYCRIVIDHSIVALKGHNLSELKDLLLKETADVKSLDTNEVKQHILEHVNSTS